MHDDDTLSDWAWMLVVTLALAAGMLTQGCASFQGEAKMAAVCQQAYNKLNAEYAVALTRVMLTSKCASFDPGQCPELDTVDAEQTARYDAAAKECSK